jgi:hypothetical protein
MNVVKIKDTYYMDLIDVQILIAKIKNTEDVLDFYWKLDEYIQGVKK